MRPAANRVSAERHHIGITLFALGAILLVLAPVLWSSLDDLFGGEHFGDLPAQLSLLSSFLMLAVVAALAVRMAQPRQSGRIPAGPLNVFRGPASRFRKLSGNLRFVIDESGSQIMATISTSDTRPASRPSSALS